MRPAVPGGRDVSGDDALDDLMRALRDERRLAAATLLGLRRSPRHSFARLATGDLLRAGVDINTIRAWLGHVSIDTTNVYAEVDLETKAQMLAAYGPFMPGKAAAGAGATIRPYAVPPQPVRPAGYVV